MQILGLDLGSSTGWAFGTPETPFMAGTWQLATDKNLRYAKKLRADRRLDIRASCLLDKLMAVHHKDKIDLLVWEDVQFGKSLAQVQLWSSFRGVCWAFAHTHGIQTDCLAVGKLKRFATGNGSALKPQMAAALVRQDPRFRLDGDAVRDTLTGELLTDDAVDAIHLFRWALTLLT